ncbi:MAG: hypothetical protein SAJ12_02060 [Jaaginema sp. PMC 1079.18]|nr:hypothetical protein [Jaaginema sp. PMC 1080.18]MEC4849772.1 hypothetical protein [Jaaginema sp. PMC 1079.18]MEC4866635.1 hypothetical protein [Jaaginema sp. PMC 1078.18]
MAKLNQIIAVEKGIKSKTVQELAATQRTLQKTSLFSGISRTYRPKDEEGEQLPPESNKVQVTSDEVIHHTQEVLTKLLDVTATKDWTNCNARADIVVDNQTLLSQAPVSYLLFLEKQLTDLQAFIKKLPTLDAAETWTFDPNADCWATEPVQTLKTFKTPRNHVKAEATEHHPAQVEVYYEDVTIGYWRTVKFSGALPIQRVHELLNRLEKLQQAVKFAREEANNTEAEEQRVGEQIFNYLFARS